MTKDEVFHTRKRTTLLEYRYVLVLYADRSEMKKQEEEGEMHSEITGNYRIFPRHAHQRLTQAATPSDDCELARALQEIHLRGTS